MAWIYNGVRIFVQDIADDSAQSIARLNPIAGGTVLQVFGWDDPIYKVDGLVVGETDHLAIRGMINDGVSYNLVTPETTISGLLLAKANFKRVYTIAQTLRSDLDCESPVYDVSLELYLDV